MKRIDSNTATTSIDERISIWENSTEAAKRQIELGKRLQNTGEEILTQIENSSDQVNVDTEKLVRLFSKSLENIAKGSSIEQSGHKILFELHHIKPK